MVLLFVAECLRHGSVELWALRVQDLALAVSVLDRARTDLNATLMYAMRLQLQAVLMLRMM